MGKFELTPKSNKQTYLAEVRVKHVVLRQKIHPKRSVAGNLSPKSAPHNWIVIPPKLALFGGF